MAKRPKLVPRKYDPQQKAVYKWQWQWTDWNENELDKDEVRRWVKWAFKKKFHFGKMPRIEFRKVGEHSSYNPETTTLYFLYEHRNVAVVLHETAHAIITQLYGKTVQDHGPEFMGVFLYLLEKSGRYPRSAVYDSAVKAGLKIDTAMGPELLKKKAGKP